MSASEATHHRRSATGGGCASVSDDSDDDQSWHSMSESGNVRRKSCESDCPVEEVDLESGVLELKKVLHLSKVERNCRICHMGLEGGGGTDSGSGVPIDLGCSCKGDLGAAHKQCAETWFKIKGDTTCEICGVTAFNISSEQINESNATAATSASVPAAPMILVETRTMWHGRRIMNFLLACMILAFVISWLFHFKVLS
ncbi:E3 ubiquitin-protein ligase MARCHF2 [Pyrus x bretschneideri]|uniref:E3 ubiquitin-protein ligase MARCHF2 n=1 Tax=Pyrus x bretschneideri TaxID=225117 RepID=UPI00202E16A0|nr:E3 ubiquitin-protein ligase MARCHF2 [Pyrus x bretschneideri]